MRGLSLSHIAPARRLALFTGLAALAVGAAGWASWQVAAAAAKPPAELVGWLGKQFPKTPIDEVRCDLGVKGVCEVVTGRNVFYAARDGRYVLVGSLLDLKDKVDLTDQRLRQLAAVSSATGRIGGASGPGAPPAAAPAATRIQVNLGRDSAILHNPGAPLKLTVFSDFGCGFCRQLFDELAAARDIEVTEYPIAILGPDSAQKAKLALCADDRVRAASALYRGGKVEVPPGCAEGDRRLAANMAFAEANGIAGTPALVRADGTVNRGWMALGDLRAWLKASQS